MFFKHGGIDEINLATFTDIISRCHTNARRNRVVIGLQGARAHIVYSFKETHMIGGSQGKIEVGEEKTDVVKR